MKALLVIGWIACHPDTWMIVSACDDRIYQSKAACFAALDPYDLCLPVNDEKDEKDQTQ